MYRGFNIEVNLNENEIFWDLQKEGLKLYAENTQKVKLTLDKFVNSDNSLDGTAIQNSWFPLIESDIFISHSHKNKDTAIVLAAWIWNKFKLKTFIDSCIWGYSNDLLRMIDNRHCYIPVRDVYDYNLRNHSTSHVHMMLSTALSMMIDKSECLFFLNTPNSIKSYEKTEKTESPWIYSEIAITQIIEKKESKRLIELNESFSHLEGIDEIKKGLKMTHDVDLSHLTNINYDDLLSWQSSINKREHPLDTLYKLYPPFSNN